MGGETIRLWGIDAPEFSGGCVEYARDAGRLLEAMLAEGSIRCGRPPDGQDRDRYGRLVRVCVFGEETDDVGQMMVAGGYAWDWPRFSGGHYAMQQSVAEAFDLGTWADDTCRPDWWEGD